MGEGDVEMIFGRIEEVTAALRARNALPCHVTLLELRGWAHRLGMSGNELLFRLRALRDSGRIEVGRTLNDWWIRPVEGKEAK